MDVGVSGPLRARRTIASGTARPLDGPEPTWAANTVPATRPLASTSGPPELPCVTSTAKRSHLALDRALPIGVLARHQPGEAQPSRRSRAGRRSPDSRPPPTGVPRRGRALELQGSSASGPRRAARRCRCAARSARRSRRSSAPPTSLTAVSSEPATTWAFVTTSPVRRPSPIPGCPSRRRCSGPARRCAPRPAGASRGSPRGGTRTFASGPRTSGVGSIRRRELRSGPLGGNVSFSAVSTVEFWIASRRLAVLLAAGGERHRA